MFSLVVVRPYIEWIPMGIKMCLVYSARKNWQYFWITFFGKPFGNARISVTAQKRKFSIEDFFSERDQVCSFLHIWSLLLKKSLSEDFILCAVSHPQVLELVRFQEVYYQKLSETEYKQDGIYLLKVNKLKLQNNMWNLLKVNSKDTRTVSMTFWCLYCLLWTDFNHFNVANVSIAQVNAGWKNLFLKRRLTKFHYKAAKVLENLQ